MTTLTRNRPPVKPARHARPRPFGEGIVDAEGWPDERVGLATPEVIDRVPPGKGPRGFRPSAEDSAWISGFSLALAGIDAEPEAHWPGRVRAAFADGHNWGAFELDREMEAASSAPAEEDDPIESGYGYM